MAKIQKMMTMVIKMDTNNTIEMEMANSLIRTKTKATEEDLTSAMALTTVLKIKPKMTAPVNQKSKRSPCMNYYLKC